MKPGNLLIQGAKSGGKTKDEDSINSRIESSVCGFFYEKEEKEWKKDCLLRNVLPAVTPTR